MALMSCTHQLAMRHKLASARVSLLYDDKSPSNKYQRRTNIRSKDGNSNMAQIQSSTMIKIQSQQQTARKAE